MFCRYCGSQLKLDSKFCENCGKPRNIKSEHAEEKDVNNNEGERSSTRIANHSENQENKKEKNSIIPIYIGVGTALLIIIGIAAAMSQAPSPSTNERAAATSTLSAVATTSSKSVSMSLPAVASTKNTPAVTQGLENTSANTSEALSTSFIGNIEPAIVLVVCFPPNFSSGDSFDYGSGVSVNYSGVIYIETNYHVYNGENTGEGLPTCYAYYPGPAPDFSINSKLGGYQLSLHGDYYDPSTSEDVADFTLDGTAPSSAPLASVPVINSTSITGIGVGCSNVNSGDGVTIFGYPASGNYLNVSETVTEGTISGQTPGPIYKFDGAIDHGNSGGLAVLDKNTCDLGIPTLGVSGLTAGTGYIQSIQLARTPVTLSDDQICQNQYGENSIYLSNNSQGGITCGCASGYTWNSSDTACVEIPPETGYQVCSETSNETWDGTYNSAGGYNCVCDVGYAYYGGQCISDYSYCTDTEGYGANYDAGTNSCTCSAGYIYSGGQCVAGNLYCSDRYGVGAEYDYSTNGCTCEYGYESNGYGCVYQGY